MMILIVGALSGVLLAKVDRELPVTETAIRDGGQMEAIRTALPTSPTRCLTRFTTRSVGFWPKSARQWPREHERALVRLPHSMLTPAVLPHAAIVKPRSRRRLIIRR